jgi:hypothetical protein
MNVVLLALSVVLPLLPVVLFPTRFFGRGMASTVLGAALLVGMMMLMYFGLQTLTGDGNTATDPDAAALAGVSDEDLAALEKLLGSS